MIRSGLVVSLGSDSPDPLLDCHSSTTPGLDTGQDLRGRVLLEGSPFGSLVRPAVELPLEMGGTRPLRRGPSEVSAGRQVANGGLENGALVR